MTRVVGHALSIALGGDILEGPSYPEVFDVRNGTAYGNTFYGGPLTGTYDVPNIQMVDVNIQLEDDLQT